MTTIKNGKEYMGWVYIYIYVSSKYIYTDIGNKVLNARIKKKKEKKKEKTK